MGCWKEEEIDLAAMRLAAVGVRVPAGDQSLPEDVPPEIRDLLSHSTGCDRCRELLDLLLETEIRYRDVVAAEGSEQAGIVAEGESGSIEVLRLLPYRGSAWPEAPQAASDEHEDLYSVAADGSVPEADPGEVLADTRVLTLTSEDGRFHVRIFPDESGLGATAILIPPGADSDGDAPSPTGKAPAAGRRILLRVRGEDHAFGPDGVLRLPDFPGAELALVLH